MESTSASPLTDQSQHSDSFHGNASAAQYPTAQTVLLASLLSALVLAIVLGEPITQITILHNDTTGEEANQY